MPQPAQVDCMVLTEKTQDCLNSKLPVVQVGWGTGCQCGAFEACDDSLSSSVCLETLPWRSSSSHSQGFERSQEDRTTPRPLLDGLTHCILKHPVSKKARVLGAVSRLSTEGPGPGPGSGPGSGNRPREGPHLP